MRLRAAFVLLAALVVLARFSQLDLVWIEEAYPMAAAAEMLRGKMLYRDIWFDKPPLYALVYLLWGAAPGWALRLAGSLYVGLSSWLAWRCALERWGRREAAIAASLLAIYLTFGIPSAVMVLAPDLLTVAPHIAALWLAWRKQPTWAGFFAGLAFLANPKAALVLAACALWCGNGWPKLLLGFVLPNLFLIAVLAAKGALGAYWEQVWVWGAIYSRSTFVANPLFEGLLRTVNWAGFQAAAVAGAVCYAWRERDRKMMAWTILCLAGVIVGLRFFPRYYFLLLPPVVLMGARGIAIMKRPAAIAVLALVLIPMVRFGPRYARLLTGDRQWSDIAMMQDSRHAAAILREIASPGDALLVWGYRPDIFVFSGLPAGTRYLDSQPLTGVIADRHLTDPRPSTTPRPLDGPLPNLIADGLGPYNPSLAAARFLDLSAYREAGRTPGTILYRRRE